MAGFTVRVELHKATWDDYDVLHAAMEQKGFSRRIQGDNGQNYRLPWAEYSCFGNLSCEQIRDVAQQAANLTGKGNSIFVTEAIKWAWSGLQVA